MWEVFAKLAERSLRELWEMGSIFQCSKVAAKRKGVIEQFP
jgi:hypothetical protein